MSECVRCKSKCKLPIFCNSCYQESFKSGERRGRVEELKYILKEITKMDSNITSGDEMLELIEKRLLELKK